MAKHRDIQVQTWEGGRGALEGFAIVQILPNNAFTFGPFLHWLDVQVHGSTVSSLEYVLVGPPGSYPGITPDRAPLPDQRTPIRMPPGVKLTINNGSSSATRAISLVWTVLP